jgi:hypothetical protein
MPICKIAKSPSVAVICSKGSVIGAVEQVMAANEALTCSASTWNGSPRLCDTSGLAEGVLGEPDTRPPAYVKLNRFHLACQGDGAVALLPATGTPAPPGRPIAVTAVQPPRGQRVPLPEAFRHDGRLHHSIGGWDEQSAVPPLDFAPGAGGCSVLGGAHIRMLHASLLRLVHLLAWCLKSGPGDCRASRVAPHHPARGGPDCPSANRRGVVVRCVGWGELSFGFRGGGWACGSCSCS